MPQYRDCVKLYQGISHHTYKSRDLAQALNEDNTARTMETLTMGCPPASHIPHLDLLDFPLSTESSLPTSFDEDYMKTGRKTVAFDKQFQS
ncbi:unnamed protein product [Cylicostephanus goldi]|uniref:Uncharacterized protein n=1 Tax=Cylicostephanus goldi TaxID=71465 RepID=A0A3P6R8I1_CYLGO|nr:unnamed protein product [Cylicostephanus goldi]